MCQQYSLGDIFSDQLTNYRFVNFEDVINNSIRNCRIPILNYFMTEHRDLFIRQIGWTLGMTLCYSSAADRYDIYESVLYIFDTLGVSLLVRNELLIQMIRNKSITVDIINAVCDRLLKTNPTFLDNLYVYWLIYYDYEHCPIPYVEKWVSYDTILTYRDVDVRQQYIDSLEEDSYLLNINIE